MKNRWICIFLAALLLLTAAGCGKKEAQQTAEPDPPAQAEQNSAAPQTPDAADISAPQGETADAAEAQNLRVACWGDDLGLIAARLKDFEAAHPELAVETVQYASETEFLTAMGAGKLPDVIWCGYDRSRLELLAAKGYLAELDGLVDSLCAESAYFENVLRLGALSGHVYFLTPGFTLTAFSAPERVLRQAEKIETVAQFDEIFRPYCPEGYGWTTREIAMNWFMNDGLSAFVDLTTGTANFTQARFYEILDFCRQFPVEFEAATAEQMFRTIEFYEPLCILREYEHYERLNGDEPGVTIQPLPFSAQDGYGVRGESYLAITSGCQNNAAAELLLREAFSLPMQKRACVQYKAGSEEDVDVVWCIPVRKVLCDILWRYSDADVPSELSEEELGPWKADIEETNKAYDELLAMIARADHFEGGGDRTLYEIVTEEAARFFDGACTEEEAAQAIDRRAELYLMEQR